MNITNRAILHFENVLIRLEREVVQTPDPNCVRSVSEHLEKQIKVNALPEGAVDILEEIRDYTRGLRIEENTLDLHKIEIKNLLCKYLPRAIMSYRLLTNPTEEQKEIFLDNLDRMSRSLREHLRYMNKTRDPDKQFEVFSRFLETKYG